MTDETIVKLWRQGHSRNYIIGEERKWLKVLNENMKRKELDETARRNVEQALLRWWRKNV